MHRETGVPLEGVTAEFYIDKYNPIKRDREFKKVSESQSDNLGFVYSSMENNESFQVKFSYGKDVLFLNDRFSDYRYTQNNQQILTHFFLDRAIYRPGQTIYFKGIVIQYDNDQMPSIYAKQKVTITFSRTLFQILDKNSPLVRMQLH